MKTHNPEFQADGCTWIRFVCCQLIICAVFLVATAAVRSQPPSAPELLPKNTVAYIRIADTPELLKRLGKTATGRMLRDPAIEPIVNDLYDSAMEAFHGIEDELGLSFEQLRSIPQGEICLALVAPEQGSPAFMALIGVQQEAANADKVIRYLQTKMTERGDVKSTEMVGHTKLTILTRVGKQKRQTVFFQQDETIGVTSDLDLAKQMLSMWRGETDGPTLADNQDFAAIMKRCIVTDDEQPQLTYFIDPLGIARSLASDNMALQMGLSLLSQHGLDGFHGFGGSLLFGGKHFESVHHTHFLVDSSREGVLEILAPKTGDVSPERWVPSDVATYLTLHWDIPKSYAAFVAAFDSVRGPGTWDKAVKRSFVGQLGVDLQRDVLNELEGRVTRITWISNSMKTRRAATMTGMKLKDAAVARHTLESVVNRNARTQFTKRIAKGFNYYEYQPRSARPNAADEKATSAHSYVAILGDYLLLSDNEALIKQTIDTKRGDLPSLGDELDFKLNASRIALLPGGDKPSMISFTRPEVGLRASYVLVASEETRNRLSELAGKNQLIRAINKALTDHPLPPFSVVAKYFAFSGRLMTTDTTGIHSVGFTFRRD